MDAPAMTAAGPSPAPSERRSVAVIARHELRHMLRSGSGILAVVITLVTFLSIGNLFVRGLAFADQAMPAQSAEPATPRESSQESAQESQRESPGAAARHRRERIALGPPPTAGIYRALGEGVAAHFLGLDLDQVSYMIDQRPALVSALYLFLCLFLPFLAVLGTANQTAGAIERKSLRFQLPRATRRAIVVGRFLAFALFTEVVVLGSVAILAIYVAANVHAYPARETLTYFVHVGLALGLLALPYVALAALFSVLASKPRTALAFAALATGVVPLAAKVAASYSGVLGYLGYLTPWPFKFQLVHPRLGPELGAAVALVLYTAIYLLLALRVFARRDL